MHLNLDDENIDIVWLTEYRCFGVLLNRGATHSFVGYYFEEEWYEELIDNDEYEFWRERVTDYERN